MYNFRLSYKIKFKKSFGSKLLYNKYRSNMQLGKGDGKRNKIDSA